MLLEKLEVKGFKSFGDKITINFDEGITGIVGPNGCGKSNVVDAIRWVLGEQRTRALRSEKMENIIFNGTKKRKALQLAEVSLSFSNTKNILPTEYSSVTITRRYYRSGDSEYELNGVKCRLKDITNLFMDTGVTSNSYAIIELGMVDDILNDKENARRGLFEEAAGISKFKKRKKETLRRLEDTDADLDRVEDLLYEIEGNLKSLEKQARQAQRYYKLKDEYKESSIHLAHVNMARHKKAFDNLNKQIQEENDKKISLTKQVAEKEAAIEKSKTELITKEKALSARQKALNDHVNKIRQYESDKKIKNERLRFLNDKSENLKEQIDQDKKSHDRASFSIDSLINEKQSALKIFDEVKVKLEAHREDKESQASKTNLLQEEVNALSEVFKNKREEVFNLNKSVEIKEIQTTSLKQELEKASTDTSEQSASLVIFEKKTQELEQNLKDKKKAFEKLKSSEESIRKRIEDTEKTIEVIREELVQINRKLDARQNEYNLTKSLVDNLEGFPEAIKFLKKDSGWGKNVPLLSDVVTCAEEFRVTIENFLEPYMNYYVVESEADAYKAVNLLSDASKGRAHFFILDSFEKYHPSPSKLFDNASPASEIVEYDGKYKRLISYLLDNVYITEGDHSQIPEEDSCIFITKNGKVTKKRFSISGGSVGLFEGKKIGRARNLDKLQKEIKSLEKQLDKVNPSLKDKQDELEKLKSGSHQKELEDLQIDINHINEEFISISTKHEQYSQFLNSTDVKKEDLLSKIDELGKELEDLRPRSQKEESSLQEFEIKLNSLNEELKGQSSLYSEKSAAFNEENIYFHQQENKVNSLDQEIGYKKNTLEATRERINKNTEDLKINESEIRELVETTSSSDDVLIEMYNEKESIEAGVNEAEKEYYAVRGDIDQAEKTERDIQHRREDIDSLLMELHNRLNEIKIELNGVKERLSVEFNINIDELKLEDGEADVDELDETGVEELRARVEKIRDRLENMGPINPMAMEAYDEIQQRHEFITTQKEDLIKAKESLLTTIEEIDMVAKATFLETFSSIKDNFIRVFRSLFTDEDTCDLILTNPDNPLESSIEIIAKPKGKKPLTINQLSGGEKTLTATSLLFAIYLIKPAPFCIFDEVDAPLDDANIDKFNNIIHKFAEESQFIIVTHNKRTMVSTDVIYGITMAEQGVSRVVPVDLRQLA
jgi:chromosome segregation protein